MMPSRKMQHVISEIATHHSLDLSLREALLHLEQPGFMPLVIEKLGDSITVAHYDIHDGELTPNPAVVFYVGAGLWMPTDITQSGQDKRPAFISEREQDSVKVSNEPEEQADLARFCDSWAGSLASQGWLDASATNADSLDWSL